MKNMPAQFCVVGLGNHSLTKLIPALLENGQTLAAVVSSQTVEALGEATTHFSNLDDALQALPKGVVFLIGSPPQVHYDQCKNILLAGHHVIVEKPAFVREAEAREMVALANKQGLVLAEALMYRHSALFTQFMADIHAKGSNLEALQINFLLPDLPAGTFRDGAQLGCSVVYDIGCYALSLLAEIGVHPEDVIFKHLVYDGDMLMCAVLTGSNARGMPKIDISVGVGTAYENSVRLVWQDGSSIEYRPFFFGRPGKRNIHHHSPEQRVDHQVVIEQNSFSKMLSCPLNSWIENQEERSERMIAVTRALEKLEMARLQG
jgi:predicted dehydrogenase